MTGENLLYILKGYCWPPVATRPNYVGIRRDDLSLRQTETAVILTKPPRKLRIYSCEYLDNVLIWFIRQVQEIISAPTTRTALTADEIKPCDPTCSTWWCFGNRQTNVFDQTPHGRKPSMPGLRERISRVTRSSDNYTDSSKRVICRGAQSEESWRGERRGSIPAGGIRSR
ncbi:hypothetical protein HDV57DRAFT_490217 [Trichoderma longibrachiatum]|uniref:Uncharacterized protein n=1 Tax=Trichoderma longibrachiatum ATCC 18648 TaxID=983965 RepID=A0A2T4C447_TRILO|nr:hypothetical protein M440DRAFT_1250810 [Trichoderma longibrachiatum ATCC 18648]